MTNIFLILPLPTMFIIIQSLCIQNNILIINHDDIAEILLKLESGVKHHNPTDYHWYIYNLPLVILP